MIGTILTSLAIFGLGVGGIYVMIKNTPLDSPLEQVFEISGLHVKKDKITLKPLLIRNFEIKNEGEVVGIQYQYTIPIGKSIEDFELIQDKIRNATKAYSIEVTANSLGNVANIKIFTKPFEKEIAFSPKQIEGKILGIPIGYTLEKFIAIDLADLPHLLVAGITGFGKSNFIHQTIAILSNLSHCRLFAIDFKKTEFSYLKRHCWLGTSLDEAEKIINYLHTEMHRRLDYFSELEIVKISEYKGDDLPYFVLFIDEFSQLCPQLEPSKEKKERKKELQSKLVDLLCLSRASGICIVLSMQRPDKEILSGQLKANLNGTVAFRTRNRVNSEIALDNIKASKLSYKGRAYLQYFEGEYEVQTMYLPVSEAKKLLPKVPLTKPEICSELEKIEITKQKAEEVTNDGEA